MENDTRDFKRITQKYLAYPSCRLKWYSKCNRLKCQNYTIYKMKCYKYCDKYIQLRTYHFRYNLFACCLLLSSYRQFICHPWNIGTKGRNILRGLLLNYSLNAPLNFPFLNIHDSWFWERYFMTLRVRWYVFKYFLSW